MTPISSSKVQQAGDHVALFEGQIASIYRASSRELVRTLYTGAEASDCLLAQLRGRPVVVAMSKHIAWARDALSGELLWCKAPSLRNEFLCAPVPIRRGDEPTFGFKLVGKWGSSARLCDLATGRERRASGEGFHGAWDAAGWYAVQEPDALCFKDEADRALARVPVAPKEAPVQVGQVTAGGQRFNVSTFAVAFGKPAHVSMSPTEALIVSGTEVGCIDRSGAALWAVTLPAWTFVDAATRAPDGWRLLLSRGDAKTVARAGAGEIQTLREEPLGAAFFAGMLLREDFSLVGVDDGAPLGALPEPALADVQTSARLDEAGEPLPSLMAARGKRAAALLVERASQPAEPAQLGAGLDLDALVAACRGWKIEAETLPSGLRTLARGSSEVEWQEGEGIRQRSVFERRTTRLGVLPGAAGLVLHVTREQSSDSRASTVTELLGPLQPPEAASWIALGAV